MQRVRRPLFVRQGAGMSTPKQVLFAISDTGGGHRSAAEAMTAAITELAGDAASCDAVDLLRLTELPLVRDAPALYDQLSTHWLPLYDAGFALTDGPRRSAMLLDFVYLHARRHLLLQLVQRRPQLVVVVHPLAVRLVASVRRAYRLPFRVVTVVTDLVSLHASWSDAGADCCVVPTQEAWDTMRRRHFPAERLVLSGFPIHPKFAQQGLDRQAARAALGVNPRPFTLLLTSGGVGAGRVRQLVALLRRELPAFQLLVVTGRNEELRRDLTKAQCDPLLTVYGYVRNMEQLMAASDVVLTKAGPGTLMEALTLRRPVLLTEAVGRQEQGNIDWVLNHELGAYCPTDERLLESLRSLSDPAAYQATCKRLEGLVPRNGVGQLAQLLLDELDLAPQGSWADIGRRRPLNWLPLGV